MDRSTTGVDIGACQCPGTPHDHDEVHLRNRLGLKGGTQLQTLVLADNAQQQEGKPEGGPADSWAVASTTAALTEAYLKVGVVAWNLIDANGKPLPVTPQTIEEQLLSDFTRSAPVAEKGNDLYYGPVIGPLVPEDASSSQTTPTESSTSPTEVGSPKSPMPSKPSSIFTTPTEDTETTSDSPDGGSRSSQIEPMAQLREVS